MHRQVEEYSHRHHNVPMRSYVPDLPELVPYTLTACSSAANMLSVEPPFVAASPHPASGVPTPEALDDQAVCVRLSCPLLMV